MKTIWIFLKKNGADIITASRILLGIVLLFVPAFSTVFYVLYLSAGFTDMIDGTVARKTGSASEKGAKLDTVADFVFVTACAVKLIPAIRISTAVTVLICVISAIKIVSTVCGFALKKQFTVNHNLLNKLTGFLLFLFPLSLSMIDVKYSSFVLCAVALTAAVYEMYSVVFGK